MLLSADGSREAALQRRVLELEFDRARLRAALAARDPGFVLPPAARPRAEQRISFRAFAVGCLAFFLPHRDHFYVAFHQNCPQFYLNADEITGGVKHSFIVGEILAIERRVAGSEGGGGEESPLREGMKDGKEYHVVTARKVMLGDPAGTDW
jgi:hypothetical protein